MRLRSASQDQQGTAANAHPSDRPITSDSKPGIQDRTIDRGTNVSSASESDEVSAPALVVMAIPLTGIRCSYRLLDEIIAFAQKQASYGLLKCLYNRNEQTNVIESYHRQLAMATESFQVFFDSTMASLRLLMSVVD